MSVHGELYRQLLSKLVKIREGAQNLDNRVVYSFFQRLAYENEAVVKEAKADWQRMTPADWAVKWLDER